MDITDKASAEAYIRVWVAEGVSSAKLARMFARTAGEQRFCEGSRRSNGLDNCANGHAAAAQTLDAAAAFHTVAAEAASAEAEVKQAAQEQAQIKYFADMRAKYPNSRLT